MSTRVLVLFFAASLVLGSVAPMARAESGALTEAKVALHLKPFSSKSICLPASQGGEAPDLTPCSQFVTEGLTGTGYNAYLVVVAPGGVTAGVAGLSCGIEYDPDPQSGVDVFSWVTCADLEFLNAGAHGDWPASGGGNRMTFDYTLNCQLSTVPGYEAEGVVAVFGAFYVYAYDTDYFSVTPNLNLLSGPELVVGACTGGETDLYPDVAGTAAFSVDGVIRGCNPCLQVCDELPTCGVPSSLDFGTVLLGETKELSFAVTNIGIDDMDGNVASGCGSFTVVAGAGSYTLVPGQSRTVTVRYEATIAGFESCNLFVGGLCSAVYLSAFTPPPCTVSPSSLHLGTLAQGDTATGQFTVFNNQAGDLTFELTYDCPDYTVLEGTGPFTLGAGQNMTLTVQLIPSEIKAYNCTIDTGTECASVSVTALVLSDEPVCDIYPASLDFGSVQLGQSTYRSFEITNTGSGTLTGTVSETCPDYSFVSGGGSFLLGTNQTRIVTVRFTPSHIGFQGCTIQVSGGCTDVLASGIGFTAPPGDQDNAVIALHASPHFQSVPPCYGDPTMPCSDYEVEWPVGGGVGCNLWLVVARGNVEPGIGGLACGILYDDGQTGAATLRNGSGVDVYEWNLCTSGLQFPNGPTGLPEDEWPASGGGNTITWDVTVDCQTTTYGTDGVHAVAGYFYVYAYSEDLFKVTPNNNLAGDPAFQAADCEGAVYDLDYPQAAGICGFGTYGYNPCSSPVPVRLLSFAAARTDDGAEVAWVVAGADEDHLGFEVWRGETVDDRVPISREPLSGRERYVFVDDAPPSTAVSYWLAERSRTGETTWHGPVELEAASGAASGFALHRASPNPFLGATRIAFRTGADGPVTVRVFDATGREVARPHQGDLPAGEHEVAWDGRTADGARLSAGIYFYRVETAEGGAAGKVVLIR